ncbi:glycosyltransferase family 1 protein, partial [Polynucleobacter sp. UK-Mo-2m-Kol15]|nr:glycosyltransferase family 1 protein [Polynucleobacter sp. UK-Mo-2m-Kol15]
IPRFIRLLVDEREDLKQVFNLEKITGQLACAEWWEKIGKDQYPRLQWQTAQFWQSLAHADEQADDVSHIPRFIRLLVDEREDLKQVFNLEKITGQLACAEWWEKIGKDQYPLMSEISFSPLLFSK